MNTYRVLLVESKRIHRMYLEQVIHDTKGYILVGTESNMEEALKLCEHIPVDLVLMAANDKEGNTNFAAALTCKQRYPLIRIIMMTESAEYSYPERAKDCGADSFWYMESKTDSITAIMDKTMDGKSVWPRRLPSVKVGQMESRLFSEKELLILRGVAKGHSNKEIAGMLQISYYTVRDYVKDMLEKTGTKSRTALAVAAVGSGLIVLDKNETNPPDGKCILKSDSWNKDEG
ncbi:MAG: response regulator transcription factor [Anaerotignum sp.]|nr:response regulator transcription factor [Anaerotignum sp.]